MNCLEFRRLKLADPKRLPPAAQAHLQECATCRGFAQRIDALDQRIGQALAIPVPEGLSDRVLLRAAGRPAPRPWRLWALAATVVLSAVVGLGYFTTAPEGDLARLAIAHVKDEPESLVTLRDPDPQKVRAILASFGAEPMAPLGTVRYIKNCPVPGGIGWHIVFETEHGLATLLLMPGQRGRRSLYASGDGMNAAAHPGGQGYYAVVADSPQRLQQLDDMLRARLHWS